MYGDIFKTSLIKSDARLAFICSYASSSWSSGVRSVCLRSSDVELSSPDNSLADAKSTKEGKRSRYLLSIFSGFSETTCFPASVITIVARAGLSRSPAFLRYVFAHPTLFLNTVYFAKAALRFSISSRRRSFSRFNDSLSFLPSANPSSLPTFLPSSLPFFLFALATRSNALIS